MTDAAIIELYFSRSEQAIAESETSYGGYCYRVETAFSTTAPTPRRA